MKQKAGKLSFIILAMTMTMGLMTGCSGKSSEKSESNDDKITLNANSYFESGVGKIRADRDSE